MEIRFGFDKHGGFVAGFAGTDLVEYAYPTSEYATKARRNPEAIATIMAASAMNIPLRYQADRGAYMWGKIVA